MGTVLEAVETVRGHDRTSTDLAAEAARRALRGASAELLVNASVYRDGSVMEPANATFVQRSINGRGRMLSFDVANGACGVLNAVQIVHGFIETGAVRRGLVVTADVDPTPGVSQGYAYDPVGGAVTLVPGGPGEGFEAFWQWTYPEHAALHHSTIEWTGTHHAVRLREDPALHAHAMACIGDASDRIFSQTGLRHNDVDLVVTSPTDTGAEGPVHTAGVVMALDRVAAAVADGARRVLVLVSGSGITVTAASYVAPGRAGGR